MGKTTNRKGYQEFDPSSIQVDKIQKLKKCLIS